MTAFGFALPSGSGPWVAGRAPQPRGARRLRSASDAAAGGAPAQQQGMNPVLKSGLISGSLSLAGDMLAQFLTSRQEATPAGYDVARAARMGSFGLLFYGPYQYFWYGALDRAFPGRSLLNFASKVTLNQLALAPVTITMAFALNLAFQGQLGSLPAKLRADFLPTMKNGWKFWIPAASVNFFFMPLQYQVLYMSTCGMLWTGYLSYAGAKKRA